MQLDLRAALKDSQELSVRPFREISPRRCTAFPAIFNISKLTQDREMGKKAEGEAERTGAGVRRDRGALSKIKISFGQTERALSRSSPGVR